MLLEFVSLALSLASNPLLLARSLLRFCTHFTIHHNQEKFLLPINNLKPYSSVYHTFCDRGGSLRPFFPRRLYIYPKG